MNVGRGWRKNNDGQIALPLFQVIMDSWTQQVGYPLVTLRRHGNLIHASQKHFLLVNTSLIASPAYPSSVNASQKWYVPLSFTTSASPTDENQIWMHGKDGTTTTIRDTYERKHDKY